jgi:hypothetical protein
MLRRSFQSMPSGEGNGGVLFVGLGVHRFLGEARN